MRCWLSIEEKRQKDKKDSRSPKTLRASWSHGLTGVLPEFDVPVSKIDEMFPTVVVVQAEIDLNERPPLGPLRLANEVHAGLLWRSIGF